MPSILTSLVLTPVQRRAATLRDMPIAVTAGAGSGKTRALVGRYLSLLEDGLPLRSVIAITFTDKAAREMRARIRRQIMDWLAMDAPDKSRWQAALADLDGARIGTIHSLCAQILRAHPAEAGLDPRFDVLEEGVAATLGTRAVQAALAWAATDSAAAELFSLLTENGLHEILAALIGKRLEAESLLSRDIRAAWEGELALAVDRFAKDDAVLGALDTLRDAAAVRASGNLAERVAALVERWSAFQAARAQGDWNAVLTALFAMRRQDMPGNVGKAGAAKDAVKLLRAKYDETLKWLGGAKSADAPPGWPLDMQIARALPQVRRVVEQALAEYRRLKDERQALDFDDLEAGAVALLTGVASETVRKRWQAETRAVLVDEFQDTNERQRQIVYALSGFGPAAPRSTLFVVGDAKQSIYRFRGADVTVFRRVQDDVKASGGQSLEFDLTFRAHEQLVQATNALLEPILGPADPHRPYLVPFDRLRAERKSPREGVREPFVEFCLGLGENAQAGRAIASAALAARLIRLHEEEGVEWGDVALLFRASTAFGIYEDALERAGIPFVTVAGRGFYERPEIRDLLNALVAIADPSDDLAMAGLLRSPALGLSDATIYLLRWDGDTPRSLCKAVADFKSHTLNIEEDEERRVEWARDIIAGLNQWAGRATVAEVLKRFLDATGYLAMLQLVQGGARLRRNVEKLLADAHKSGLVGVSDFLEYIQALRDVGARESEAPVEAGGAVQLMTVHKAKGLEFPVVVIADAAHERHGGRGHVLLDSDLGVLFALQDRQDHSQSVMRRLGALRDDDREEAEDRRLLYVAATRARDKLIVNGHTRRKQDGALSLDGWLERLGTVTGLTELALADGLAAPYSVELRKGVACTLHPVLPELPAQAAGRAPSVASLPSPGPGTLDLAAPLATVATQSADDKTRLREAELPQRVWRVVPRAKRPAGPAWVVGQLVHEAIRRWHFPAVPDPAFFYPHALQAGLTDPAEINAAVRAAQRLLSRFQSHPLWAEMNSAERWHELPFAVQGDAGIMDVLYRSGETWTIVDFKTDEIRHAEKVKQRVDAKKYADQVRRYADAVQAQLGIRPRTILVFLNVAGRVMVI